jgi:cytoskeletal protein RodZ
MMDQTVGTILRLKREEKNLTLDQVFQVIKIRTNYLQAIENDDFDQLPSRAQARGFIRLYANYLDLDPYPLLDQLNRAETPVEPIIPASESEITPPLEEKARVVVDDLLQKGKDSLKEGINTGAQKLQDSLNKLSEIIPYRIIKRGEPFPAAKPVKTVSKAEQDRIQSTQSAKTSYRAMCEAIGAELREKRESLGLSLADAERQIKIREIYLYSIEEGNLSELPSTVQGRGMLSNYASFLGLDSEAFLSRFAEALQQKRLETLPENKAGIPLPVPPQKEKITGIRRLASPDLIFTGGLFLVFFVFIIWGSAQLLNINSQPLNPTAIPISDLLLSSGTPASSDMVTIEGATALATEAGLSAFTPVDNLQETLLATSTSQIQIIVVAHHRAFMQVTVDGKNAFLNRVTPGSIYSFYGNTTIDLLTGDGSAIEVYYNQTSLGILGNASQVVEYRFSPTSYTNLSALNTATPTPSQAPTLTSQPTNTPTVTPEEPTPSPTPTL